MTRKLCQNANVEHGGNIFQSANPACTVEHLSTSLFCSVRGTSGYFEMQKSSHVMGCFEEINKMQVAG